MLLRLADHAGKWATERKELPLKDVAAAGGRDDLADVLPARGRGHHSSDGVADQAGQPSNRRRAGETVAETVAAGSVHLRRYVERLSCTRRRARMLRAWPAPRAAAVSQMKPVTRKQRGAIRTGHAITTSWE